MKLKIYGKLNGVDAESENPRASIETNRILSMKCFHFPYSENKWRRCRTCIKLIWKLYEIYWPISSASDAKNKKKCPPYHPRDQLKPNQMKGIRLRLRSSRSVWFARIFPKSVLYHDSRAFAPNSPDTLKSIKTFSTIPNIRSNDSANFHISGLFIIFTKMNRMPRQRWPHRGWAAKELAFLARDLHIDRAQLGFRLLKSIRLTHAAFISMASTWSMGHLYWTLNRIYRAMTNPNRKQADWRRAIIWRVFILYTLLTYLNTFFEGGGEWCEFFHSWKMTTRQWLKLVDFERNWNRERFSTSIFIEMATQIIRCLTLFLMISLTLVVWFLHHFNGIQSKIPVLFSSFSKWLFFVPKCSKRGVCFYTKYSVWKLLQQTQKWFKHDFSPSLIRF